jgi:hypothetical protein
MALAHASFQAGGVNANYLQPVIDAAWAKYRTQNLEFALDNLGSFVGRVNGDVMVFTGANGANGAKHYPGTLTACGNFPTVLPMTMSRTKALHCTPVHLLT